MAEPSRMRRWLASWDAHWFATGPVHGLALLRIAVGAFLVLRFLLYLPGAGLLFSDAGFLRPAWALPFSPSVVPAYVLVTLTVAFALMATLGMFTRLSLLGCLALFAYHWSLSFHVMSASYDTLTALVLLCLVFSPCGRVWSIDAWRAERRAAAFDPVGCLWAQRMLIVIVSTLYVGTACFKIRSPAWADGDLLLWTLQGEWGTPLAFVVAGWDLPAGVYDIAALGTVLLELVLPVLLLSKRWFALGAVLGTAFHVGVALLLGIWQFLLLPATYPLFMRAERVEPLVCRFRDLLRRTEST